MRTSRFEGPWLIASALLLASCSTGHSPSLTNPSNATSGGVATDRSSVGASATGDLKSGGGALDLVRLRMDRLSSPGVSVFRQYVNPGQSYSIRAGETIELWAEWNFNEVSGTPRFRVEWGDGGVDIIHCGPCLLSHRYPNEGLYTLKASLDDRVSTTVTRTFALDSRLPTAGPTPSPTPEFRVDISVELTRGRTPVPNTCTQGDFECQAKAVCDFVTGENCIRQDYNCWDGHSGSYYPPSGLNGDDFNFSPLDVLGGYGNICVCDRNNRGLMARYELASLWQYCGLGQWNRR